MFTVCIGFPKTLACIIEIKTDICVQSASSQGPISQIRVQIEWPLHFYFSKNCMKTIEMFKTGNCSKGLMSVYVVASSKPKMGP